MLTLNSAYTIKFRTGGSKTIEGVECKEVSYIQDIHIEQSIERHLEHLVMVYILR